MSDVKWAEVADRIEAIPEALWRERFRLRLSLRDVARESGCSFTTITRVEHGADCNTPAAVALARWLADAVTRPDPLPPWEAKR